MRPQHLGHTQRAFAQPTRRLPISLERIIDHAHYTEGVGRRKRIEADACLQYLDRSCGFAHIHQGATESIVNEIGIEGEGSLEFGDAGVVPALVHQDISKLSASWWQAG